MPVPNDLRRALAAALLALTFLAPRMRAQDAGDAHEAFGRELVAAANAGDSATLGTLLAPRFPAEASTQLATAMRTLLRLRAQGGPLALVKLESPGRLNTFVTLRSPSRARDALVNVGWSRTDPTKLRYVELLKVWDPAADALPWTPAHGLGEIADRLDRNISALARMGAYSGTVLVAHRDSVIFARGYGFANVEDSVRNDLSTRYHTASMGKMFTAVAIGQLIEAGKLRLDDTLASVLPDYPNRERAAQVTIRQLLAHTAGMGDLWSHPGYRNGPFATNRDLAWAVSSGPLLFAPGTRWSYSNEGFTVLGAIVERLSGERFGAYLARHIWQPAGMTGATIGSKDSPIPQRAFGYAPADEDVLGIEPLRRQGADLGPASDAHGAGGEFASAADFLHFAQALRNDRLLGRAMRDTLWTGRSAIPWDGNAKYASGFMRMNVQGHDYVGHGGGGGYGIDNMLYFSADGSWTIVVLGNFNPPAASNLAASIAAFLATSEVRP